MSADSSYDSPELRSLASARRGQASKASRLRPDNISYEIATQAGSISILVDLSLGFSIDNLFYPY